MIKKLAIVIGLLVWVANSSFAQVDYKLTYFNGKSFFREGKYNLAMETFKKVIPYDQANPFSAYASFYYALSAYNQGYLAVAKDMLNQIKSLYPKWDKMEEVNFWMGRIMLESKDYFQGLKILSNIHDTKLQLVINTVEQKALVKIEDKETLRMMNEEYPKNEIIGRLLAKYLSRDLSNADDKALLESIISRYDLKRTEFIPELPKTIFKDKYAISVLFPFMVNTLDPTTSKKRNQTVLDLYEGMKLALDTLAKQGVNISLRAYDTERNPEKIRKILDTDELRNTDLIVGPIFPEENKVVQDFSMLNRINVFNPVSNNSENITDNTYAFLFQPSVETLGSKAGEFLSSYSRKKNCIVFYGNTKRDSVLAANFVRKAGETGLKVVSVQPVTREGSAKIVTLLATPIEFDEFKYPKEFSLKKDSIGSIFVASDDALIYSKVISSVETRGDSIMVVGSENWLENAGLEKYQRLGVVLSAPNYTNHTNPYYKAFVKHFVNVHGRTPNNFSKLGYEFMLFVGLQLKNNGVYFQDAWANQSFIPGYLSEGFKFQFTRNNQIVPFVKFVDGELKVISK
jgi:tetratricopeptide (TPR) repeat protein